MNKIGRNDPCPCGSGKKYKKCCLSNDEAARAAELVHVKEMTDDNLDAFFDVPSACWVCGKTANPFIMSGFDNDGLAPDSVTIKIGDHKVAVHIGCMPEAERRLVATPTFQTPKGEFKNWTWCHHCERTHRTEKWVTNDWRCPGIGCDGTLADAHDFKNPHGLPMVSYFSPDHFSRPVYLETPTEGGYYPLSPKWGDDNELVKIGTRGRWVDQVWIPEHPIELRRVQLPDGGWFEGKVQLRQCQICGQEECCLLGDCWDCQKIYCVKCNGGFGKCKECAGQR